MYSNNLHDDDCFALRQAARHISKLYERYLSEAGITPTQFSILRTLHGGAGLTMNGLPTAMLMDRTTLVRALKPLLHGGLVAAHVDGKGNRLRVVLTERGSKKHDDAAAHWADAQADFERAFGQREAERLREELFRMTTSLSDR
ncbi:MarR family winged helix-turn-helix transcriptional regulator [Caballeronia glebae]|jgi:DNA-binding MarR family transcriptional regulator|uniref:MarR family winged helix-turn-helix transcriptional regulator n=1 Tax=Caballeronia glebae TaxID=1777143 RepID=UPI0038B8B7B0